MVNRHKRYSFFCVFDYFGLTEQLLVRLIEITKSTRPNKLFKNSKTFGKVKQTKTQKFR